MSAYETHLRWPEPPRAEIATAKSAISRVFADIDPNVQKYVPLASVVEELRERDITRATVHWAIFELERDKLIQRCFIDNVEHIEQKRELWPTDFEDKSPSEALRSIESDVERLRIEKLRWLGLTWTGRDFMSDRQTAINFLSLGLWLIDNGRDKYLSDDQNAEPGQRCLIALLRLGCELARVVHGGGEATEEMIDRMFRDLQHADRSNDLCKWRSHIDAVHYGISLGEQHGFTVRMPVPPLLINDETSERANTSKLFPKGVPSNTDLVDLAVRINAEQGSGKSLNQIAREFLPGNERKAKSLLAIVRRMRREGRINL